MSATKQTRVFKSGNSWAVRLPAEFRFRSDVVFISRDDTTGVVTISERPGSAAWEAFFRLREATDVPTDFMKDRPMNGVLEPGGIFDDWKE